MIGYAFYKQAGELFPDSYDETVTKRWGVQLKVGSSIISFSILVPVPVADQCTFTGYQILLHNVWNNTRA